MNVPRKLLAEISLIINQALSGREQGDLHEWFKKEHKYTLDKIPCSIDSIATKIPLKLIPETT